MRLVISSLVLAILMTTPALPGQNDYNGRWQIFATTDRGQCARLFRFKVRVNKGKAYMVGRSVNGAQTAIGARGDVLISYVKGRDVINASGRLKGSKGWGSWTYPTYRCTGQWRAERLPWRRKVK